LVWKQEPRAETPADAKDHGHSPSIDNPQPIIPNHSFWNSIDIDIGYLITLILRSRTVVGLLKESFLLEMAESITMTRRPSLRGVSGIFLVYFNALLAGQVSAQIQTRIVGGAKVDEGEYPYFGA
jgi:hypothetical protein